LTIKLKYKILFLILIIGIKFGYAQNHFTESFENPDSWSGYTTGTVTFDSGDWDFVEVYPENSSNSHDGSKACRINDDEAGASITSPSINSVGTVSFYYHRPFSGTGSFELQKSVGGGSYTTLSTVDYSSITSPTLYSYDVNDASNNIKIRIVNDDNTAHLTIDYLTIGTYTVASGPTITNISNSPLIPTSSQTVSVTADVTDADGVFGVELHWGTSSGSLGTTINMSNTSGDTYETDTDIPAQTNGTTIYYEIYALDNNTDDNTSAEYNYTVSNPSTTVTIHEDDFSNCGSTQWIQESVASNADWSCGSGVFEINAYSSSAAAEDYLISPSLNLDNYTDEELSFQSWTRYSDTYYPAVELLFTTNYTGNPSTTTWNSSLSATFSAENSQSWTSSGIIDISGISGTNVRFAFKYTSSGTGGGSSSYWKIDDILIEGENATSSFTLSMTDDGNITEGNEDAEEIEIKVLGDTLAASLNIANWSFSNLPAGVSVASVNRQNDSIAKLTLSGNATTDYDNDIINFTVEIQNSEFKNLSSASKTVSSGVTFIANDDAESITLTDDGAIYEGSEDGEIITVNLSGGTFVNTLNTANWSFTNQPTGVTIGSLNRINSTEVEITLSGNASSDYDVDITNAEISIDADEIDDHSGADISENTGITFIAIIEPAPTVQASNINFTSINANSISLSWTRGNGDNCIVVCSETNQIDSIPSNSSDYNDDNDFGSGDEIGSGNYVVYNGSGNSITVNNLNQGFEYHFQVFEYNNSGLNTKYNTNQATLNPDSSITEPNNVTNFNLDCISKTSAKLSWTNPVGVYDGIVIAARQSTNSVHVLNGRGDTISSDTVFGNGYEFGLTTPKSYVVYNGISNEVEISGLIPGSDYTFMAYTYHGDVWSSGTSKSPQTAEIPEISNLSHYAPSNTINISWSNPVFSCADEVMLVMKEASAITTNPTGDGSIYSANSVFTSGTDIGTNEYVVYKGTGNNVEVTGLTNGIEYYFKIFIRDNSDWSDGVEDSNTPDDISILFPSDLAIVSVNTNTGSGNDEISIICFDTLKTGTAIDLTDNGWERDNPEQWGNTEGTIRFTRTGADIPPGEIFTFRGKDSPSNFSGVGLSDNGWSVSSLNANYNFNLNTTDQVWIMQYGSWDAGTTNNHDATYSGNVLYGWTATGWAGDPGHGTGTSYSALYPNSTCFNTNVSGTSDKDRVKYTGPTTAATKREWIQRFNNEANWTGYSTTSNHQAASPQYHLGVSFNILPNTYSEGEWIGDRDSNWYYCGNWGTLEVPDENTNISISSNSTKSAVISSTATYSDDFNDTAHCYNLTIEQDSLILISSDDILNINGNLNINGGVLNPNSAKIDIKGNWTSLNANSFVESLSIVNFNGSAQQSFNINSGTETFNRIYIDNSLGLIINSEVESDSLIFKQGKIFLQDYNLTVNTAISAYDNSKYIATKNSKSNAGYLIMAANGSNIVFPIGTKSSYNPISIKTTSGGSVDYKVRTFDTIYENGYSGNALLGKVVYKSFAIELNSAPNATADIGLQWNFLEEDAAFSTERNSALMVQNPANGSGNLWNDWSVISTSLSPSGSGPFIINATGITNFGVFGIVVRCEILKPNTSAIYHY